MHHAPSIEVAKKKTAKPAKKKKATPATTRSTAGPGFRFEDQVAAWLLLQALDEATIRTVMLALSEGHTIAEITRRRRIVSDLKFRAFRRHYRALGKRIATVIGTIIRRIARNEQYDCSGFARLQRSRKHVWRRQRSRRRWTRI